MDCWCEITEWGQLSSPLVTILNNSQPVTNGVKTKDNQQQNSQNGHASQGNQQASGPQDGGPAVVLTQGDSCKEVGPGRLQEGNEWPKGWEKDGMTTWRTEGTSS